MPELIEVTELYPAIQGEGPNLGRPSMFLRLRRCNLACVWCDSKQTWDKNHPDFETYRTMPPAFLARDLWEVGTMNGRRLPPLGLVITGGEPLIWQRLLPEVIDRYQELVGQDLAVEVETNGMIEPSNEMLDRCHFNVSPKLESAGNEHITQARLHNADAARSYLEEDAIFKLVVGEVDELTCKVYISWLVTVAKTVDLGGGVKMTPEDWKAYVLQRVYLMPEGLTQIDLCKNQGRVLELAEELGVNATTRMHIIAYNDERRR